MISIRAVNIGLVRDATVDLSELSIVMGMNNSGKSTIATVLYATIKAANSFQDRLSGYQIQLGANASNRARAARLGQVLAEQAAASESGRLDPSEMDRAINKFSPELLEDFGEVLAGELSRGLGTTLNEISSRSQESGRRLPSKIIVETPKWHVNVSLTAKGVVVTSKIIEMTATPIESLPMFVLDKPDESDFGFFSTYVLPEFSSALFADFPRSAHYLPAARSGLLQSHRLVAAAMIQRSSMVGLQELSMPSLSGVVADFISEILVSEGKRERDFTRQARAIEEKVLHGSVQQVNRGAGYPEIEFSDEHGSHPIHRTSSMVSELAPVVLLLKSAVKRGDLVILEEPESHLHPAAQVEFAKVIFSLAQSGMRIFLTTHSDFFLSTVDNLTRGERVNRQQGRRKRITTKAYWMDSPKSGSRLQEIKIDPIDGISADSFIDVALHLYDIKTDQQNLLLGKQAD